MKATLRMALFAGAAAGMFFVQACCAEKCNEANTASQKTHDGKTYPMTKKECAAAVAAREWYGKSGPCRKKTVLCANRMPKRFCAKCACCGTPVIVVTDLEDFFLVPVLPLPNSVQKKAEPAVPDKKEALKVVHPNVKAAAEKTPEKDGKAEKKSVQNTPADDGPGVLLFFTEEEEVPEK